MNCNRNCLYQKSGLCNLKLSSSDAENRCPLMPDDALPDAPYKPPMTNSDRIRGMSDEELAEILACPYQNDGLCFKAENCEKCIIDWLRQPEEEV